MIITHSWADNWVRGKLNIPVHLKLKIMRPRHRVNIYFNLIQLWFSDWNEIKINVLSACACHKNVSTFASSSCIIEIFFTKISLKASQIYWIGNSVTKVMKKHIFLTRLCKCTHICISLCYFKKYFHIESLTNFYLIR